MIEPQTEHIVTDSPELSFVDLETSPLSDVSSEESHLPVVRQLIVALGLLVVVFGVTYIGTITALIKPSNDSNQVFVKAEIADANGPHPTNPFDTTALIGRAAFVWDVKEQKVIFNKNADDELPLASITKLMTALVAYELLDEDASVNISIDSIKADGDSGLSDGESFSIRNLTDLTLVTSSNDGATALSAAAGDSVDLGQDANKLFVEAMNLRADELGLQKTHFNNATGLDVSTSKAGAYSTAREVAFLMEYIITHYPNVTALTTVDTTRILNSDGEYHLAKNTNGIVTKIDGLIASKTGYTELAGGNLVVAFDAGLNRPIIITVLGSTQEGRFNDVLDLVKRSREYVATYSQ